MQTKNNNDILESIISNSRLATLFVRSVAENAGMEFNDIKCLDYLMVKKSATAGEIAKITGLTTGAVTAMIKRLKKLGFVKTETDLNDKRKTIIVFVSRKNKPTKIANLFFKNKVAKELRKYNRKEQLLIADWNKKMAQLFQEEINRLRKLQK